MLIFIGINLLSNTGMKVSEVFGVIRISLRCVLSNPLISVLDEFGNRYSCVFGGAFLESCESLERKEELEEV